MYTKFKTLCSASLTILIEISVKISESGFKKTFTFRLRHKKKPRNSNRKISYICTLVCCPFLDVELWQINTKRSWHPLCFSRIYEMLRSGIKIFFKYYNLKK